MRADLALILCQLVRIWAMSAPSLQLWARALLLAASHASFQSQTSSASILSSIAAGLSKSETKKRGMTQQNYPHSWRRPNFTSDTAATRCGHLHLHRLSHPRRHRHRPFGGSLLCPTKPVIRPHPLLRLCRPSHRPCHHLDRPSHHHRRQRPKHRRRSWSIGSRQVTSRPADATAGLASWPRH